MIAGMETVHQAPISPSPVRFREAVAAWKKRDPMPKKDFDALEADAEEHAFDVAAAAQADLVTDVFEAIESAIANGDTLEDFKDAVGEQLEQSWGGADASRLETIFRTNVNTAYNEGRHSVFSAPAVKEARPYWRFDLIDDDRICDICEDCGGVVLPADDPWWEEHLPPLHFNCRCSFNALSDDEAREEGVDEEGPDSDADDGFGTAPDEEGEDWDATEADRPAAIGDVLDDVLDR